MRRTAVLSACVLGGALLVPGSTALASDETQHNDEDQVQFIAVEDGFAFVLPDGTTYTEENPPPEEGTPEEQEPPVGTQLFISEVVYSTDDGETRGDEVGRTHIQCTVQVTHLEVLCDIAWVFDSGDQLLGSVAVDFADEETMDFDIAVTGGTGEFSDVEGVVHLTDVSDPEDPEGETVSLYELHLS